MPPPPHYGKQMRVHDSALASNERCYTTKAKKEEIFSDMSWAPFTAAKETTSKRVQSTTPTVLQRYSSWYQAAEHATRHQATLQDVTQQQQPRRNAEVLHVGTRHDQHKAQKENWLVSGLKDHRYLSVTRMRHRGASGQATNTQSNGSQRYVMNHRQAGTIGPELLTTY